MSKFIKVTQAFNKVANTLTKNSPALFTAAGVIGMTSTVVLTYRAKDKLEVITEKIEKNNRHIKELDAISEELNTPGPDGRLSDEKFASIKHRQAQIELEVEPYSRMDIAKDVAAALATSAAKNVVFEKKYKEKHGEEEYNKFAHTVQEEVTYLDGKGKEKQKEVDVKDLTNSLTDYWWDDSEHFVSDDEEYNQAFINEKLSHIDLALFQRGTLTLNAALQALGFAPTKAGAAVGWTSGNFFAETRRVNVYNKETDREEPNLLVHFSQPAFIYDKEDYIPTLMGMC